MKLGELTICHAKNEKHLLIPIVDIMNIHVHYYQFTSFKMERKKSR